MSFSHLSTELIIGIGDNLNRKDLKSFVEVSRGLYYILTPMLNRFALQSELKITAFYCAVANRNEQLVRLLLAKGEYFNVGHFLQQDNSVKCFTVPLKGPVDEWVELFLNNGTRLLVVQEAYLGSTPLHRAVQYGRNIMLKKILNTGIGMTGMRDTRGRTPLYYAVTEKNVLAVHLLLEKGIDVNCQDIYGNTPLHEAAWRGEKLITLLLLKAGADVSIRDAGRLNAADYAGIHAQDDLVALLLRSASPRFRFNTKRTAIHFAASRGYLALAITELDKGVDINAVDEDGSTALHVAARHGYFNIVELLLEMGAEVDAQNSEGWTPLFTAIRLPGSESNISVKEIIKKLLEKGANPETKTKSGLSAIDFINSVPMNTLRDNLGSELFEQILIQINVNSQTKDIGRTALHLAAQNASVDCVRILLENGSDLTKRDNYGWSALHYAARRSYDGANIRFLVERGADVTLRTATRETAIDIAYRDRRIHLSLLLKANADFWTIRGRLTTLHLAVKTKNKEFIEKLLNNSNIDINATDSKFRTALHYAIRAYSTPITELLLKRGADPTIGDIHGSPPFSRVAHGKSYMYDTEYEIFD